MIYYEHNEQSHPNSKLPNTIVENGVLFEGLEQITGADFIIVPEKSNYEKIADLRESGKSYFEIAENLNIAIEKVISLNNKDKETVLHEWLFAGAILVQRKSGYDFLQSMGPRLNDSIAKMCEVSHKQYQRIVLVTGLFSQDGELLLLNGNKTNYKWSSYLGAVSSIKYKGCCVEFVPSDGNIIEWIKVQENQLLKYKRENIKWVVPTVYYSPDMPEIDDPLQLMRPVTDARLAMVNIKGWGQNKVNTLQKYVQECLELQNRYPTLYQLLSYATSYETALHCAGIGKTLIQNARDYVGLQPGEYLQIENENITIQKGKIV